MPNISSIFPNLTEEQLAIHCQQKFGFIPNWLTSMIEKKEK